MSDDGPATGLGSGLHAAIGAANLRSIFNGKTKIIVGFSAAAVMGLIAWLFSTVETLRLEVGRMEDRVISMRTDFESQRTADVNFQAEVRVSLQSSQSEMRLAVQHVADILTEVRVRLGEDKRK